MKAAIVSEASDRGGELEGARHRGPSNMKAAIVGSPHAEILGALLEPHRGELVVQGLPSCLGTVDRVVGRVAIALRRWDAAEEALAAAEATERAIGAPTFLARTLLDRARLAAARGAHDDARRWAATARSLGEAHELRRLIEEIDALVPEAAAPPRDRSPLPAPVLSRREREVLSLVAKGSTNKEIAAALFISVHTVDRHLANIYAKLDVHGRAEATAFAIRSNLA
jgi:DNA-binding NarL/FixJ family response regulator